VDENVHWKSCGNI